MTSSYKLFALFILLSAQPFIALSQTTWDGSESDRWRDADNWTAGVPDASTDAIITDMSAPNQPELRGGGGDGDCLSLTIGNGMTLTVSDDFNIAGDLIIDAGGSLLHEKKHIFLAGDFLNSGSYTAANDKRRVVLTGTGQTIGGSTETVFERLYINDGSDATLAVNITINTLMELRGSFDPTEDFTVSGTGEIELIGTAVLFVKAPTFLENYAHAGGTTFGDNTTVVNYASAINDQVIDDGFNYPNLTISGGMTKSLEGNTTIDEDLTILNGTLDLLTFTADRSSSGGNITIASGATLKIGGTNSFPANYVTDLLAPTSTVEYYGTDQTVTNEGYGNLILSHSIAGLATKTMPATPLVISGSLTSSSSPGTLSFTSGNGITVLGNTTLGSSTTFNSSTYDLEISGNFTNNGSYVGTNGTFISNASGAILSGSGSFSMGDVDIRGNATTLNENSSVIMSGDFETSGGGSFSHTTGGTGDITFNGAGKTISGSGITFDDLVISGSSSITTSSSFDIAGNLTADGTFTASAGTISFSGTSKNIAGSAALQLVGANFSGSISTSRDLSISGNVTVPGTFTASNGEVTFNGTSSLDGTLSLFDVLVDDASTLTMGSGSAINISGIETLGTGADFDATTNIPNTVNYNSTGAQSITFDNFHNLIVSNGNTKTASAGVTINGDLTIASSTTLDASSFTHSIKGDWNNNGTFTAVTSTIEFIGTENSSLTGATTFNDLTVNKGSTNTITLENNITVVNLVMTSGKILTGSNAITITSDRTGNGLIIGTITRTHSYTTATDYAFEGPNNTINFSSITGTITSITITVEDNKPSSFPYSESINREYGIAVTGGTAYNATLRLHYEDVELAGNDETLLTLWNDGGTNTWGEIGSSGNSTTDNWVEDSGLTNLEDQWSLCDGLKVLSWTGANSTSWTDAGNWTVTAGAPSPIPGVDDVAVFGDISFTNQPSITTAALAKTLYFESLTASTLTLGSSGTITTGNILGEWLLGDASHTIAVGAETLVATSDLELSRGTTNQVIDLTVSTGSVTVNGTLTQSGGADIIYSGAGSLNLGGDFNYSSGNFTASSNTVTYNGSADQNIGEVTYNDLVIAKSAGIATLNAATDVTGNLEITTGGQLNVGGALDVNGNMDIGTGTTVNGLLANINVGGNWILDGTFIPGSSTSVFDGNGAQTVDATTFNNLTVNKSSGTLSLQGDLVLNGNVDITSGTVDASTFLISRATPGGSASMSAGAYLRFGGASLQIANFLSLNLDPTSSIEYYTTATRSLLPITYGNLIINNGGTNAKTMLGATTVAGDLTVNTGATLRAHTTTLTLGGDLTVDGTFDANSGTVILNGADNTSNGVITFNDVIVNGSYDHQSGNSIIDGQLHVTTGGDMSFGNVSMTLNGDLTNEGTLFSSGTTTFSGTQTQTIRLLNAISSTSTGVVNFNGTVAPILNSSSSATLATFNLNNTGGFTSSTPLTVLVSFTIGAGATWNAGPFSHVISGQFVNNGTVNTSGSLLFNTPFPRTINLGTMNTTGLIEFGGSGAITLVHNAQNFSSVVVSNTNAAGVTAADNWTLSDDLLITTGAELNGGAGLTHTISGQWTCNGIFDGETSIVILDSSTGSDAIAGTGDKNFNDLTFPIGTDMDISSPIAVSGDFTNNTSLLDLSSGKVSFIGSGLSVIGGTEVSSFGEIEIDKSSNGVRMDLDAIVTDNMILTDGQLDLNANTLTISNSLSAAVSRTNGYILSENTSNDSKVLWTIGTDMDEHVFPFGNASAAYIPFSFDLSSGDAGTVSVATYPTGNDNTPFPPGVTDLEADGIDNSGNTVDRFFQIDLTGETTPTATITFTASAAEVGGITGLVAQRWDGSIWESVLPGQSQTATSVTVPNVTQFSPWAMSGNGYPLPIELISFTGNYSHGHTELNWSTASELNNDRFEIYKSENGKEFDKIGTVLGGGTTNQPLNYSFSDYQVNPGLIYYRLNQIDFDGTEYIKGIITVLVAPSTRSAKAYLSDSKNLKIDLLGFENQEVDVKVMDIRGTVYYQNSISQSVENSTTRVDIKNLPKSGMYLIILSANSFHHVEKIYFR